MMILITTKSTWRKSWLGSLTSTNLSLPLIATMKMAMIKRKTRRKRMRETKRKKRRPWSMMMKRNLLLTPQ